MSELQGQAAVVTGASRGIGAATARALAEAGAAVVLASRATDEIEALAAEIRAAGGKAEPVRCDVSRYADVARAVETCGERFGRIDILVNNAGVIDPIGHLAESDPEAWGQATDINFKGVYHGLRAVLPLMKAQGSGTVVNISSGAAHSPLEGWSHYCAAKAAAHMLTRAADLECRPNGVTVVGLSPGTVATYMQEAIKGSGMNPVSQLDWSAHIPPEWPARAVVWLCGPEGREFAGQEVKLREEEIRRRVGLIP
jgi:NAD(P)-dependent dehydrogenase (short-subunit alcohol dehydrogenase family)